MSETERRLIGRRIRRIEDPALLRGGGRYVDDVAIPGVLHAAFARSQHAHALLRHINRDAALAVPGVVAVLTAADLAPVLARPRLPLGFLTDALPPDITPFVLPAEELCYVGEGFALVVAQSRYTAEDGVAALAPDCEPLPVVADCRAAIDPSAPRARRESPTNVIAHFSVAYGNRRQAVEAAPHVFREHFFQHRGVAHPLEPRGIAVLPEPQTGKLTVWSSTQMAHELSFVLADMLGLSENLVHVIAPDVGGGFGAKYMVYPEEVAVAAAARVLQRPVKWIEDRGEHFVSAIQERDQYWEVEIAVDRDGRIDAIGGTLIHDQGAYTPQGLGSPYNSANSLTGPYIVPNFELEVFATQTNKVYTIPLRGAGYPQAAFVMERLLDRVASELGLDRAELRRRNLVPAAKMPYEKPIRSRLSATDRGGTPVVLDSGDYPGAQQRVLDAIDYAGFTARQREARCEGRYIGFGMAHAVKGTGRNPFESGAVKVTSTGRISVLTGAMPMGQGIKTALAQICAETLGVEVEAVEVIAGDTAFISLGVGGFASRQAVIAGSAVHFAAQKVREKALTAAAMMLEADPADLVLRDGKVEVDGVPGLSVPLGRIARQLRGVPGNRVMGGIEPGLEAVIYWEPETMTFANAFHACEAEVDPVTGGVRLLRYVALQDSGRMINPLIVEGQIHGGIAHGIGNALFEFMHYDAEGQPLSTTFADYLLPGIDEVPRLELIFTESPALSNPLGVKGVGECGTIPVTACIAGAVEDALSPFGVRVTDVPILPVRIVELLRGAGAQLSNTTGPVAKNRQGG